MIKSGSDHVRLVVLYRPPGSCKNKLTKIMFLQEFAEFLELLSLSTGKLLIVGDFNFHLDEPNDSNTVKLFTLLQSITLSQHVNEPTHKSGHILDLIITRSTENFISDISVHHLLDCVHFSIFGHINLEKNKPAMKEIEYRKMRAIDIDQF